MEKYELEQRYEDEEIDLVEIFKTLIKEKLLISIVTVIFTISAVGFSFYKANEYKNYGVEITFSNETNNKITEYSETYKNVLPIFNRTIQKSFNTLLEKSENNDVTVISSEDFIKISEIMKKEYKFIKILDLKNKNYKLFTNIQYKEVNNMLSTFTNIVNSDTTYINLEFNKNLSSEIILAEETLKNLTREIEILNAKIMDIVEKDFSSISKENLNSNLLIVSPILYVEYQQKINTLNSLYSKLTSLKELEKNSKNLFSFTGEKKITLINTSDSSSSSPLTPMLIIAIGFIVGLFIGMFFAVIKAPLKNILLEIKKEK